jgi:pimeloyl-ACP methyl ester carboxylesterase
MLTWFLFVDELAKRYRVITMDPRWHGRGIHSEDFSLADCADDVAALVDVLDLEKVIVVGYSMGSIIAQRVWRQHPDVVAGLVLCSTTNRFRNTPTERLFHQTMEVGMGAARTVASNRVGSFMARAAATALDLDNDDAYAWALREFRSTSPWAIAHAVAALGRHHSSPWLKRIDVPVAVIVTTKDWVLAPDRQRSVAMAIPGATMHEVEMGHSGIVSSKDKFQPVLLEAVATVVARSRDQGLLASAC